MTTDVQSFQYFMCLFTYKAGLACGTLMFSCNMWNLELLTGNFCYSSVVSSFTAVYGTSSSLNQWINSRPPLGAMSLTGPGKPFLPTASK